MSEKEELGNSLYKKIIIFNKKNSNKVFSCFLLLYFIFGFILAIRTGISTDEFIEQTNWKLSRDAIKEFFGYNKDGYTNLFAYEWKFHGVAHHYFSRLYLLFVNLIFSFEQFSEETSNVLLNHGFIFFVYFFYQLF